MPVTNANNPTAEKPRATKVQAAPVARELLAAAGSPDPTVQFLTSKRGHIVAAIADGHSTETELAAVDAELAALGFRA